MSTTASSFRLPFPLPDDVHEHVRNAMRLTYQKCVDLDQAVKALNTKVNSNTKAVTNVVTTVQAASSGGGGGGTPPVFGNVNLQPNLTPGAYVLSQTDLGGLILVNSSIAFALTLNSSLMLPFFTTVYNFGAGTVTATPSAGTGNVNNVASVALTTGQFGIFYFDGTNWWDVFALLAQTFAAIPSNWLRSYDSTTGLFTASQPAASDLSNGVTGTGAVVLATSPSLATPKITGLPVFANNAAAITGGLVAGNLYRTGADPDFIAVVH